MGVVVGRAEDLAHLRAEGQSQQLLAILPIAKDVSAGLDRESLELSSDPQVLEDTYSVGAQLNAGTNRRELGGLLENDVIDALPPQSQSESNAADPGAHDNDSHGSDGGPR